MDRKISIGKKERGQGLVEYTLLGILIAIPLIAVFSAFGPEIKIIAGQLFGAASGGFSVHNGEVTIPNISPTLTPTPLPSPTPTVPACTPGNASNITSKSACQNLRDINNCSSYSYNSRRDTCSWH
jgi:Flp pilus assembly pilin Flp